MQVVEGKLWTRVAEFISYDDYPRINDVVSHYLTSVFFFVFFNQN